MDKINYPSSSEKFINGSELVSGITPPYLNKASDDMLFELRAKAEKAIAYYSYNGHPDMVRSLEAVISDIMDESNNRKYKSQLKEQEKAKMKMKKSISTSMDDGCVYEFGKVDKPKIDKDDW